MARYQYPADANAHPAWVSISVRKRITTEVTESRTRSTERIEDEVYLYMPTALSFNDGLAFDQVQLSNAVSAATGAVESNRGYAEAVGEAITDIGRGMISDQASRGGTGGGVAASVVLNQGFIRNPRTEMLFKGPTLRAFTMNFKLMPNSGKESNEIESIIKTLRRHAYPTVGESGATFYFPSIFSIEFVSFSGPSPRMIKLANAYCTAISTNFNPTSPAFFDDGAPAEVDLALTFQETEVITRDKVDRGY